MRSGKKEEEEEYETRTGQNRKRSGQEAKLKGRGVLWIDRSVQEEERIRRGEKEREWTGKKHTK